MSTDKVRFKYLRDPMDSRRVLTLSRVIDSQTNTVKFSYAVNAPNPGYNEHAKKYVPGDQFSKEEGRKKALARFNSDKQSFVVALNPSEHPWDAVRRAITSGLVNCPQIVRRIVAADLVGRSASCSVSDRGPSCV